MRVHPVMSVIVVFVASVFVGVVVMPRFLGSVVVPGLFVVMFAACLAIGAEFGPFGVKQAK